jgi:hypothetical protein
MHMLKGVAVAAALTLLAGCAQFTADLTPDNFHAGVSLLGTGYSKGLCGSIGKTGICTKQDQKTATKVEGGVNLLIDLWPWWPQSEQPKP